MIPLVILKDKESTPTYVIPFSEDIIGMHLLPLLETPIVVPDDADLVIFGSDNHFAYSETQFNLIVSGGPTASVPYEMDPQARLVTGGSTVYVQSYVTVALTMSFYSRAIDN